MIPEGEVGCKICDKSIYRIFVEHIANCLSTQKGSGHLIIPKKDLYDVEWRANHSFFGMVCIDCHSKPVCDQVCGRCFYCAKKAGCIK